MKDILKKIILRILHAEAKIVLRKYKPKIVAITGSVGKTSTKDAIYTVLSPVYFTRKSAKSFNSEIGIPLTILGCPNGWNNPVLWIQNIIEGIMLIIFPYNYPHWLVLEVGADRPGDIKKITNWLKPDIVVVTRLSKVPVHVEFFESVQALIKEKGFLVKALKKGGVLVLNNDDEDTLSYRGLVSAKTILFGFNEGADIIASHYKFLYKRKDGKQIPKGITFKIDYRGNCIPVTLNSALGRQHVYPALAALCVGSAENLNVVEMSENLSLHETPPGRMKLVEGIKKSTIIDDTYNSSPVAMREALETLRDIETSGRKIAVLGDMLELGKHSTEEHRNAGAFAGTVCDFLFTIGVRAQYFKEGAMGTGMNEGRIFSFEESREAGEKLKQFIKEGDIVLVKGSQSTRTERVVESVMENPENKKSLLVRQDEEWLKR